MTPIDELCCARLAHVVNGPTGAIVNALGGQTVVPERSTSYKVAYNFWLTNNIR